MQNYNIHVVSTNRADISLLYDLIILLQNSPIFNTNTIFIGEITNEQDYIENSYPLKYKEFIGKGINYSDTHNLIKQSKLLAIEYSEYINNNTKPDFLVCLGDRFELLSILQVANIYRIPILHIHGGDKTFGSMDNESRNAISKLSKLHCVVTKEAKNNLLSYGEEDWRIKIVGAPGRDILKKYVNKVSREEIFNKLNINDQRIAYVAYHPETYITEESKICSSILDPLISQGLFPIVSRPNPDPYGNKLRKELEEYSQKGKILLLKDSLGAKYICALMEQCEIMLGNSSSGIFEASLFNLPVLNIGLRQSGRPFDKNVFSIKNSQEEVFKMVKLYNGKKIKVAKSIYDYGNSANNIYEHLNNNINNIIKK